ncbi:hypothetical protein MTO96_023361 [Rhipicephalus appendiculatus]
MGKLCRHRGALRGAATRLLSEASEILLQGTLPSSADLQEIIYGFHSKDCAFTDMDRQLADVLDGEGFDEGIMVYLDCHEKIVKAVRRLRFVLNASGSVGPTVIEANQWKHAGTSGGSSNCLGTAH